MKLFNFLSEMLSEKGSPSSKRGISFMFASVVCFGVVFDVLKGINNAFDHYLFAGLLIAIFLLLGVATMPQILDIIKGKLPNIQSQPQEKSDESKSN